MNIKQVTTHDVGSHFLPALINCDMTGLGEDEVLLLNRFAEQFSDVSYTCSPEGESFFGKCEVTGLASECYELEVIHYDN